MELIGELIGALAFAIAVAAISRVIVEESRALIPWIIKLVRRAARKLAGLQNSEYEEGIIDVDLEGFVRFFNHDVMRIFELRGSIQGVHRSILNDDLYRMVSVIDRDKAEKIANSCYQHPYAVTSDVIPFIDGRMVQRTSSPRFDDHGNIIGRRWRFRFVSYYRDSYYRDSFPFRLYHEFLIGYV